jgi:hypothetical protein
MEYKKLKIKQLENVGCIEIDEKRLLTLSEDIGVIKLPRNSVMECRAIGSLQYHAIFLPSIFDWALGRDEHGGLCIVPLKKR